MLVAASATFRRALLTASPEALATAPLTLDDIHGDRNCTISHSTNSPRALFLARAVLDWRSPYPCTSPQQLGSRDRPNNNMGKVLQLDISSSKLRPQVKIVTRSR